jgi:hypothetical protein
MNAKDLNNEGTRLRRNNQVAGLSGISNWGSRGASSDFILNPKPVD